LSPIGTTYHQETHMVSEEIMPSLQDSIHFLGASIFYLKYRPAGTKKTFSHSLVGKNDKTFSHKLVGRNNGKKMGECQIRAIQLHRRIKPSM
ncbi:MAG: hypothetical protein RBS43_09135, partial [Candidatus Cloacimonas sp.]|nr:hypothetical protein [Candidatus Cloacimonas sp.]